MSDTTHNDLRVCRTYRSLQQCVEVLRAAGYTQVGHRLWTATTPLGANPARVRVLVGIRAWPDRVQVIRADSDPSGGMAA